MVPFPRISGMAPMAGMSQTKPSLAPSTGLPAASARLISSRFSPVRGGSGAIVSFAARSPSCNERVSAAATLQRGSAMRRVTGSKRVRFMSLSLLVDEAASRFRGADESDVPANRAFEIGEVLRIGSQVHGQVELVHLKIALGVEHRGEAPSRRRVAGQSAVQGLARKRD